VVVAAVAAAEGEAADFQERCLAAEAAAEGETWDTAEGAADT
jgi:hypothetical protein